MIIFFLLFLSMGILKTGRYYLAANTYTIMTVLIVSATMFHRLSPDPVAGYSSTIYFFFVVIGISALLSSMRIYIGVCVVLLLTDIAFYIMAGPLVGAAAQSSMRDSLIYSLIAIISLGGVLGALNYINSKAIKEAEKEAENNKSHSRHLARLLEQSKQAEAEQTKLQAQLLQAQKMESLGILAGGVAHDFNNLLNIISGYAQILMFDKSTDAPGYDELKLIESTANRAAQLVNQLLIFSRKADTRKSPVSLNHEIKSAVDILERTIPKMIGIEMHLDGGLWTISADPVQIEQVMLNLVVNATDAMPDGGGLIIETRNIILDEKMITRQPDMNRGNHVLLIISDTGCGMDKETVDHIFDPFFTTKEVGRGTGLGLASVYGIVTGHGGHVSCYSEPGIGTTFKIYLPAIEAGKMPGTVLPPADTGQQQGGSETILLVDDEEAIRDMTSKALKSFGYKVVTAATGEEALSVYSAQKYSIDLIILDLGMPGMGGQQCLRELISEGIRTPVLVASGYTVNGISARMIEGGAAGFIGKPYHINNLLTGIRDILD